MDQPKCYIIDLHQFKKETQKKILSKGTIIKVAGLTLVLLVGLPDVTEAATGIDKAASNLYGKILNVAKWVIIVKGGIDTIQNVAKGEFQDAKKNLLGYLLTYGILLVLPWGMNQMENLFAEAKVE